MLTRAATPTTSEKRVAVFVVETVENAQPHEGAGTCVRHFNRRRKEAGDATPLAGLLTYSVLGLGDTNLLLDRQTTTAKDCNQAASALDAALRALGGKQLHARGEANDAVGLQDGIRPWAQGLWVQMRALKSGGTPEDEDAKLATPQEAAPAAPAVPSPDVTILFGSQTGNSGEIARQLGASCPGHGITARVLHMDATSPQEVLHPGAVLLFVVSSTGDGDPPDNCARFYASMRRLKATPMGQGVKYAVLGLGDQNYTKFMAVPRYFSARMDAVGAVALCPRGEADETEGLFEYVDKWIDQLWTPLAAAIADAKHRNAAGSAEAPAATPDNGLAQAPAHSDLDGVPPLVPCRVTGAWTTAAEAAAGGVAVTDGRPAPGDGSGPAVPFHAALGPDARLLTSPSSDRVVMHVSFDVRGAGEALKSFQPGDSVGVCPPNSDADVDALLLRLGVAGDAVITLTPPDALPHVTRGCAAVGAANALRHCVEICAPPRRALLRVLAEHTAQPDEKRRLLLLSSRGGKDAYEAEVVQPRLTVAHLLALFPSCTPPFHVLLDALPPLMPRMYSVACAPEACPHTPCVAFSLVRFPAGSDGLQRTGVATGYLHRLATQQIQSREQAGTDAGAAPQVPFFIRKGGTFAPPADPATPAIMVGPGTGVAPFRGFLQRRAAAGSASSPWWLFFGCRSAEEDYLYRADFEAWAANGTLTHLVTAFSREPPVHSGGDGGKTYVQHRMLQHGSQLASLIAGGQHPPAAVYVCGDGAGMAKGVHAALLDILQQHSGMAPDAAAAHLSDMAKSGRYVRDIWSA